MVKVFEGTENEYYLDGYLKQNLDVAKSVIKKDWDMIFCVDGNEGSGKSVLAQQCAFYCDPNLSINNIVFTPGEFKKAIMSSPKYSSIVYDEAYTGLNSRATMSLINRILVSMLAEIRQKNLFVFVVMPCFFDLDKYVAIWRSRALLHIYTGDNFMRGFFAFYNADRKKNLYIIGKKFYEYKNPHPNFRGRFVNCYMVDETQYRQKKRYSLTDREKIVENKAREQELNELLFQRVVEVGEEVSHADKMRILKMPESTYFWKLRRMNQNKELV